MTIAIVNALIILPPEMGARITTLRFDRRCILSLDTPPRRGETVLDLDGKAVYPGLINAHDHLELNHFPRTRFRPVYQNAHQWGDDFLPRLEEEPFASLRRQPLDQRCRAGGLKNLRSGVTLVAHHNPLHKPLYQPDFPVRVLRRYGWAHSLHFSSEREIVRSYRRTPRNAPWMIHLAEGIDEVAAEELRRLESLRCLGANTVLIHGVGLSAEDRWRAIEAGASLVWCPSTNFYLLGQTGQVGEFAEVGRLALGTDSRLTADGNMLDELRAAHSTGQLTPEALFCAVTTGAARVLRLRHSGALLPGYLSDFFVAQIVDANPYHALLRLTPNQIEAVYIGGVRRF